MLFIIVSTHHPDNVQLTTYESKLFFYNEQKKQSSSISHFLTQRFHSLEQILVIIFP